jgi:hypothetical protein
LSACVLQSYGPWLDAAVERQRSGGEPFPESDALDETRELVKWILRFTAILLRNSLNKHLYNSVEVRPRPAMAGRVALAPPHSPLTQTP